VKHLYRSELSAQCELEKTKILLLHLAASCITAILVPSITFCIARRTAHNGAEPPGLFRLKLHLYYRITRSSFFVQCSALPSFHLNIDYIWLAYSLLRPLCCNKHHTSSIYFVHTIRRAHALQFSQINRYPTIFDIRSTIFFVKKC